MRHLMIISLLLAFSTILVPIVEQSEYAQADANSRQVISLNFDQAVFNEPCQTYINQHAGIYAASTNIDAAGIPFVVETATLGVACGFVSTSQMRIQLAQPVANIGVAYSGDMALEFRLRGQYVTNIEVSTATQSLYERALRFDELIFNSNGFSDLQLFALHFGVDMEFTNTLSEDFSNASAGVRCIDYLREQDWIGGDNADLAGPVIADSATAGQTHPECEFSANESLSILFVEPMQYVEFGVSGAVEVDLLSNGKRIKPTYSGFGPFLYRETTLATFNEIQILTGEFGVRIDNLFFAGNSTQSIPVLMIEPLVNAPCVDAFNLNEGITATTTSTTSFSTPIILSDEEQGIGCEFNPGNLVTAHFDPPFVTVGFWIHGGADVEFWQDGTPLETVDVQGLPVYYLRSFPNGIDEIRFIETSEFSSFFLSDFHYSPAP